MFHTSAFRPFRTHLLTTKGHKADAFLFNIPPSLMIFGHNRRIPTSSRPVVTLRRESGFIIVPPCAGQGKPGDRDYFEPSPGRVIRKRNPSTRNHVYRCETIPTVGLSAGTGMLSQGFKVELYPWLKNRWSE